MEEKKKEVIKPGPLLDFKKKLSNNFPTGRPRTQQFVQKPMKKVTGRGR